MKIKFSDDAKEDIQDISDYTFEVWGQKQEESYLSSISSKFEDIKANPQKYRKRDDLFINCQVAPVGRHVIFFSVEGREILVSRILHHSMDLARQVFPL